MFYWSKYRCHSNKAGNKPSLNNGFDLFSETPVVGFFHHFFPKKTQKILAY